MKKSYAFNLRLPTNLGQRLEKIQEKLSTQSFGTDINRSSVIRMLLERSLPLIEKELNINRNL